jgi:hypothetical protein
MNPSLLQYVLDTLWNLVQASRALKGGLWLWLRCRQSLLASQFHPSRILKLGLVGLGRLGLLRRAVEFYLFRSDLFVVRHLSARAALAKPLPGQEAPGTQNQNASYRRSDGDAGGGLAGQRRLALRVVGRHVEGLGYSDGVGVVVA